MQHVCLTCTKETLPVSLSRAAIPTSRPIPRPSITATMLLKSCLDEAAVWGRPVLERERAVRGRENAVAGRDDEGRPVSVPVRDMVVR